MMPTRNEPDRPAVTTASPMQPVLKEAFREALIAHIETYRLNMAELARAAGVSKDALYALTQRKTTVPGVDFALAVSAFFGKTIEEFIGYKSDDRRARINAYISMLSEEEREFLEAQLEFRVSQKSQKQK